MLSFLGLSLFLFSFSEKEVLARDIQVIASVPSGSVFAGERFTLNVDINTNEPRDISEPTLPDLRGMRYLSTSPNLSTSYTMVNQTARMTYRYSFTIEALETGTFQIPPFQVDVDGREYATRPITVVINSLHDRSQPSFSRYRDRPPIFLELELSENEPVRGQQVIAEIVLYFQNSMEVSSFQVSQSWQTEGFWREDLNDRQTRQATSIVLNGRPYRRAVLARYALFPTRSGELTIPPFSIRTTVRQSGQYRNHTDPFFDGFGQRRNINLETTELPVTILPLPQAPLEGQLISAMGQFTVERSLSRNQVVLGEAIDVITEIQGAGNLGLITRPSYDYPDVFDTHRPRETIDRDPNVPRMAGTKQFRDVLIARSVGKFVVPESIILVFNDQKRAYEKHILPELSLEVVRDPNARITLAQNDQFRIVPVKGAVRWEPAAQPDSSLWGTWWLWVMVLLPAVAIASAHRLYKYRQKLLNDELFERYEHAYDNAK
ncbi:BatD family protein, partial [Balneolaceae bacterium ANBcel3]|nr:BatD family protein [Balneolaceae bacterium ANBcel3]